MSLALVHTRAALGLSAPLVTVEVHQSNGMPALTIVGLPEAAVRESKDRVRSAVLNAGFEFPQRRLTINLAPADLPKDGGRFDLADDHPSAWNLFQACSLRCGHRVLAGLATRGLCRLVWPCFGTVA